MPKSLLQVLLAGVLLAGLLLLSCAPQPPLPGSAISALDSTWAALPGSATHDLSILRAWPGKMPQGSDPQAATPVEIWCIETSISAGEDGSTGAEKMIWISTRTGVDAAWITVPLMTMSSLWPYQACGVGP